MSHQPSPASAPANGTTDHHHHHHHHSHEGHGHHHHHHGAHGHSHAPTSFGGVFFIAILLNSLYIAGETGWGILSHSLSLLADAGHNLSDVLGLLAAWGAQILARRSPTKRFTYGFKRATILTALANATILLLVTGGIVWEAIWHLFYPDTIAGTTVSIVAAIGILINGGTALLLMRGSQHDINMRGAFLHMASDALMALAVVIAGALIAYTGASIIDPITSLIVSAVIIWSTWSLLTHALGLALDAVPQAITPQSVEDALRDLPEIADLHHLHIWPISTTETALTVHLVLQPVPADYTVAQTQIATNNLLQRATALLQERFAIHHPTFQIEPLSLTACSTAQCHTQTSCTSTEHKHTHHA